MARYWIAAHHGATLNAPWGTVDGLLHLAFGCKTRQGDGVQGVGEVGHNELC